MIAEAIAVFKLGTIQISNYLHMVEHVVQSKSEKKQHFFLCVGGGGRGKGGLLL